MSENNYRERTNEELEEMKRDLSDKTKSVIAPCCLSDSDTCYSDCPKFYDCWKYDYSSKLEKEL
ncbi:MAG: hypothetical protein M1416_00390 [Candidatus Pacearchaeota archaeon]|nr:hypothetical protein [Candidatus Pacearchaeota archaeon]